MKRATAGRTAAHVEVESTPSPDSSTTVGSPSPLHSMNMPWPSTSNVPAGGVLSDFGALPPQPASTARTANAARARIAGSVARRGGTGQGRYPLSGASVRSSEYEHSARRPGQSAHSSRCGRSVTS